jgi:hypothetical protein
MHALSITHPIFFTEMLVYECFHPAKESHPMSKDSPRNPADGPDQKRAQKPTPGEVNDTLAFVDGALGAAGHSVDDAPTREILRRQAAKEITGDEARALLRKQEGLV